MFLLEHWNHLMLEVNEIYQWIFDKDHEQDPYDLETIYSGKYQYVDRNEY
jgi:hypothetical protein